MEMMLGMMAVSLLLLAGGGPAMQGADLAKEVISLERGALDRWIKADPMGFAELAAPEITYFDPSQETRVTGAAAFVKLMESIKGLIRADRYELLNPLVQAHGDVAVLTFNFVSYGTSAAGEATTSRWNSTEVYGRIGGQWKIISSHWSQTLEGK
jgi:ketosteroid isomerase-like protein